MSNLDKDVRRAKELRMSYGRYKAMGHDPNAVPVVKKKETLCPVCGKVVQKPRVKICSDACAKIYNKEYSRQRYWSKVNGGR